MTLHELQERIRATPPAGWHVLLPGAEAEDEPVSRAVLRADVDVVLAWGMRESSLEYYDAWVGNLVRKRGPVEVERILLEVLYRGSVVDRLRGLAVGDVLLPFPKARDPRVKGLADRLFPRAEAEIWALVSALESGSDAAFQRAVFDSGLRVE